MAGNVPALNETRLLRIVQAIRDLYEGRSNAVGSVTLAASVTTTVVPAPTAGAGSHIYLTPRTANAAAEVGNGTIYVSAVIGGQFTVTHASNAQTDRTFSWGAFG